VVWRVVPHQAPWPPPRDPILSVLLAAAAALPPGPTATLLADRGWVAPAVLECAAAMDFHVVVRRRAGTGEAPRVRRGAGPAARGKDAGWRTGHLTIHWAAAAVPCRARPGAGVVSPHQARQGALGTAHAAERG